MAAGVTITIEMIVKPEWAAQVRANIPAMFEDTVKFEGFRSIRVVQHRDTSDRFMVIEEWDSAEQYQAYLDWRTSTGELDAAMATLVSMKTDVWPIVVGAAAI